MLRISIIAGLSALSLSQMPVSAQERTVQERTVPGKQIVAPGIKNPTIVKAEPQSVDGIIYVTHDRAEVVPTIKGVTSLIIGNPLIADVSVQQGGFMVVTAKGAGTTNFIGLDSKGNTVFNRLIKVQFPSEQIVRVYRGDVRETLTCTPTCLRAPTIGDGPEVFSQAIGQSVSRTATIQGAGNAPAAR
jgi:Pilus formation protein N terminal region